MKADERPQTDILQAKVHTQC